MKTIATILTALLLATPAPLRAADRKPNVVIFLVDDMGWGDLGCYGNKIIQSPNLDKFAREGMRFTQGYAACAVCSPSRSAIQTGRTPYRNGVYNWIPEGRDMHLRKSEITIATLLKNAGYATCHSGKWHLNGKFNSPEQPQPNDHGYDWWFATQNNAHPSHKDPDNFVRNGQPVGNLTGYSGQIVVNEAVEFLKHHRDPKKPFLLNICTHETHQPIEADPKFQALYPNADESHRQFYGDATQMDAAFGTLMKALEESGEADNTIVFITADNGPEGDGETKRNCGSTGGLRGRKRWLYEGGIREQFMVRWPGHIKPGSTCDQPVIGSDIFTTICEVTGVQPPADRVIDGASIVPAFRDQPIARKVPLFWHYTAPGGMHIALRDGDWKLLASEAMDKFELYNLKDDVKETTDLAAKEPQRVEQMHKTMASLVAEMAVGAPVWEKGKAREAKPERKRGAKANAATTQKTTPAAGDFAVVEGAEIGKADEGYVMNSTAEGFALKQLDQPITHQATIRLTYQGAGGGTRNACLAFGAEAKNDTLIKVGTMIGMHMHGIFQGPWSQVRKGKTLKSSFDPDAKFDASVTIDLDHHIVTLVVDDATVETSLPADLKEVRYLGYYTKGASSTFGPMKITDGGAPSNGK
jgi:arylsulfatase A